MNKILWRAASVAVNWVHQTSLHILKQTLPSALWGWKWFWSYAFPLVLAQSWVQFPPLPLLLHAKVEPNIVPFTNCLLCPYIHSIWKLIFFWFAKGNTEQNKKEQIQRERQQWYWAQLLAFCISVAAYLSSSARLWALSLDRSTGLRAIVHCKFA